MAQRFLEPQATEQPKAEQTTPEAPAKEAPPPPAAETEQAAPEAESKEPEAKEPEDTKEEADDDLSHKSSLTPEQQAAINRRIGKEVAKTKRALERAAAAEARLQSLEGAKVETPAPTAEKPQIVPLPEGAPPLANIESADTLADLHKQAKEAVRWAEEMLDVEGVENGIQVGERVYTKAELKAIRTNAKLTLEDHIPARAQFLQQREQARQAAYAEFPFLKDKTSEEYVMAQAIYKDMPWLRNVPNADWIIGLGVEGFKAVKARKAESAKPKDTKPKVEPPKPPASQAAVSAGSSVRAAAAVPKAQTVGDAFKGKGGVTGSELAAFLAKKERSLNSA